MININNKTNKTPDELGTEIRMGCFKFLGWVGLFAGGTALILGIAVRIFHLAAG